MFNMKNEEMNVDKKYWVAIIFIIILIGGFVLLFISNTEGNLQTTTQSRFDELPKYPQNLTENISKFKKESTLNPSEIQKAKNNYIILKLSAEPTEIETHINHHNGKNLTTIWDKIEVLVENNNEKIILDTLIVTIYGMHKKRIDGGGLSTIEYPLNVSQINPGDEDVITFYSAGAFLSDSEIEWISLSIER